MGNELETHDDAALLARLRAKEDRAYDELSARYAGRLYATAQRMLRNEQDAMDCVQDAFLSAFQKLDTFDSRSKLSTWLHGIVINKCLMRLRTRRRKPEKQITEFLPTFLEDGHQTHPARAWRTEARDTLHEAEVRKLVRDKIEELPENYRTVLLLRDIEQLSSEEAATVLGDTPNAVKVRLHRARQALRELLDPYLGTGDQTTEAE